MKYCNCKCNLNVKSISYQPELSRSSVYLVAIVEREKGDVGRSVATLAISEAVVNPWFWGSCPAAIPKPKRAKASSDLFPGCLGERPPTTARPLLTLYTSICYATALCATVDGYAGGDVLAGSPQAIFDQYYKNQPTDFLREI